MSKYTALFQALGKLFKKLPDETEIGSLPSEEELIKQGFDPSTFYHGSPHRNIMQFNPHSINRYQWIEQKGGEPATFFSESPEYTESFAAKGGQNVQYGSGYIGTLPHKTSTIYPVKLKLNNVFNYNNPEHIKKVTEKLNLDNEYLDEIDFKIGDAFALQTPKISKAIKDLGFEGYFTNEVDQIGKRTVGLFYPEKGNVRSIFAKFDPEQTESGNIYASIVPPVATVGGLAGLEEMVNGNDQ